MVCVGGAAIAKEGKRPLKQSDSKALVLRGSHLHYGLNWKNFNRQLRNMYQLPATQYFMLIGIMLSDGHISIQKNKKQKRGAINGYFELQQSFNKFDYVFHVFSLIGHYCNRMLKLKIKIWLSAGEQKRHFGLRIVTRSLPCFTELQNLFYIKGQKCVPTKFYHLLNPIALAHWIMGEDSYQPGGSLVLCTDSFSLQDVIHLINVLIVRYGLDCSLTHYHTRSNQKLHRIRIQKKIWIH
jgi:LAGLIDADG DNA endonuclease family